MTTRQFNTSITKLLRDFEKRMRKLTPAGQRAARAQLRNDNGVIFVKEYTVKAYFRPAPKQPRHGFTFHSLANPLH